MLTATELKNNCFYYVTAPKRIRTLARIEIVKDASLTAIKNVNNFVVFELLLVFLLTAAIRNMLTAPFVKIIGK